MSNFFIKQNSTLPELTYPVSRKTFEKYSIPEDMLKYAVATFSMFDSNNRTYSIANSPAEFIINTDKYKISSEGKYVLKYKFKEFDTEEYGKFMGEFKIDILHVDYLKKLTIPTSGMIIIYITPSITKTTVIQ